MTTSPVDSDRVRVCSDMDGSSALGWRCHSGRGRQSHALITRAAAGGVAKARPRDKGKGRLTRPAGRKSGRAGRWTHATTPPPPAEGTFSTYPPPLATHTKPTPHT